MKQRKKVSVGKTKLFGLKMFSRCLVTLMLILLSNGFVFAKDYYNEIMEAIENNELDKAKESIELFKAEEPNNVDVNIVKFNYNIAKYKTEKEAIYNDPYQGKKMVMRLYLPEEFFTESIPLLEKVLEVQPDRLDIYTGMIEVYSYGEKYSEIPDVLSKMFKRSLKNNNRWSWRGGEYSDGKKTMLEIYGSVYILIIENLAQVPEAVIKEIINTTIMYYPSELETTFFIGQYYILIGDIDASYKYFMKAFKIDPTCCDVRYSLSSYYEYVTQEYDKAYEMLMGCKNEEGKVYVMAVKRAMDLTKRMSSNKREKCEEEIKELISNGKITNK